MLADGPAAEAEPAASAVTPIAAAAAIRACMRGGVLLTSGGPFLWVRGADGGVPAVGAGPRSVVVVHTYGGGRSLLPPGQGVSTDTSSACRPKAWAAVSLPTWSVETPVAGSVAVVVLKAETPSWRT